jgi:glycerol-3-phosphate acyltransferase PlsY
VPFGYLVARLAGVDIRQVGSGNIGATNVLRVLGKPYGYTVFLLDFLKGIIGVAFSIWTVNHVLPGFQQSELLAIIAGVLCVVGHAYPVWLGFKGGKGVATSAGVVFGLMPVAAVIGTLVWLLAFQITKYVSVASITAALALPVIAFVIVHLRKTSGMELVYFSICLALVVVWRHRGNISRLTKGTESTFRRK